MHQQSPSYQQEYHGRSYTIPESQMSYATHLGSLRRMAIWCIYGILSLCALAAGYSVTFPYFWNSGWYNLAFIPWTIGFILLQATALLIFTHYQLDKISIREVPFVPPMNQPGVEEMSPETDPSTPIVIDAIPSR